MASVLKIEDGVYHGLIESNGQFPPEKGRYHLYIGEWALLGTRIDVDYLLQVSSAPSHIVQTLLGTWKGWPISSTSRLLSRTRRVMTKDGQDGNFLPLMIFTRVPQKTISSEANICMKYILGTIRIIKDDTVSQCYGTRRQIDWSTMRA